MYLYLSNGLVYSIVRCMYIKPLDVLGARAYHGLPHYHPMVISQWLHLREADARQAEVTNLQVTSARNPGFNEWEKLEFNKKSASCREIDLIYLIHTKNCFFRFGFFT